MPEREPDFDTIAEQEIEARRDAAGVEPCSDCQGRGCTTGMEPCTTCLGTGELPKPADPVTEHARQRATELLTASSDENWLGI
jgi:RecJ-like exonuclease